MRPPSSKQLIPFLAWGVLLLICGAWSAWADAALPGEPPRLHEVRLRYQVDQSRIPPWVTSRETTLIVTVGPALDVVATGDGQPVPCHYDGERALITTDATDIRVYVTEPLWDIEAIGAVSPAPLRDDKRWALSLTLDDGYVSQATTAKTLLDRYGYAATIAVVGSWIGKTSTHGTFASDKQLRAVVEAGWHLANHTNRHLTAAEIGSEVAIVQDVMLANRWIMDAVPGYTPRMFTSPFVDTAFTPIIINHRDELEFQLIQTYGWEGRQVEPGRFNGHDDLPYTLGRTQLLYEGAQFDEMHGRWTKAPDTRWWLSLHTHDVAPACDCVETSLDVLYRTYGAGGTDEVWVAPAPQVYEYLIVRDRVVVTRTERELVGEPSVTHLTATPTPTPLAQYVAVFQQGRLGYDGVDDATIDPLTGDKANGGDHGIKVRTMGQQSSVIRFSLSSVPQGAAVQAATLKLYGLMQTNDSIICLDAHPLLRPWLEQEVTWWQARVGDPWGMPGASRSGVDRTAAHVGLRGLVQGLDRWYSLEIGEAVQAWVDRPAENYGLILLGSGEAAKQITLVSSENARTDLRPMLIVTYTLPTVSPTETPIAPAGNGLLVGTVLLEGDRAPLSAAWSVPLTLTFRGEDGRLFYEESVVTGRRGEFIREGLQPDRYDLTVTGQHSLPLVRKGLEIRSGLNTVVLGPLVEGDIVRDGLVSGRDQVALSGALGSSQGEARYIPAADLNDDGLVDRRDQALLEANYGRYGEVIQHEDPGLDPASITPTASLWITPESGRVEVGQTVALDVTLDAGRQPVRGVDVWLSFDPTYLELVSALPAAPSLDLMPGHDLDGRDGRLRYVAVSLDEPLSGGQLLLSLRFMARRSTPQTRIALVRDGAHPSRVALSGHDVLKQVGAATLEIHGPTRLYLPNVRAGRAGGLAGEPDAAGSAPARTGVALPIVGHYALPGAPYQARDVRVRGDYAYLLLDTYFEQEPFVHVVDVSDPRQPVRAGDIWQNARTSDEIWLDGDRAYVANKVKGVNILGIAQPPAIAALGLFSWNECLGASQGPLVKGVHAVGNLLYVADECGLRVVDVSQPATPVLLKAVNGPFGEGVWADGTTVYLAANYYVYQSGNGGRRARPLVKVYDGAVPRNTYLLRDLIAPVDGRAVDVQVEGDYLYIAGEQGGVIVYDVSNPREPVYRDAYLTTFANKLDVFGGVVFVADDRGGLRVVDAIDPSALREVGYATWPEPAYGVSVADGYAYVAAGAAGLQVVDLTPLTPTPTPTFTPTATATATPIATPTATLTATPTATRAPVSLPLVIRNEPQPSDGRRVE